VGLRAVLTFRKKLVYYDKELLAPRPTLKLQNDVFLGFCGRHLTFEITSPAQGSPAYLVIFQGAHRSANGMWFQCILM
jgi:hypothetical protein